jgi:multiple sugar transport system permease protein
MEDKLMIGIVQTLRKTIYFLSDRRGLFPYLLLLPALFFYTIFLILPLLGTIVISFTEWSGLNFATMKFIGFDNFIRMANDPFFWKALFNSSLFVVCALIFEVGLGLLLAILLESKLRGSEFFRGVFLLPSILSMVVIGLLFGFIFDPSLGLIDLLLNKVGLDGPKLGWLGTPVINVYVTIAVHIWRAFGFTMFLLIAGLQSIPSELTEAARLDGASPWELTTKITIPLIKPVLVVTAMLSSISAMRVFDLVYVMTGGGPYYASETVVTYSYQLGLGTVGNQFGYSTAIAFVLLLIIMGMSFLQLYLTRSTDV